MLRVSLVLLCCVLLKRYGLVSQIVCLASSFVRCKIHLDSKDARSIRIERCKIDHDRKDAKIAYKSKSRVATFCETINSSDIRQCREYKRIRRHIGSISLKKDTCPRFRSLLSVKHLSGRFATIVVLIRTFPSPFLPPGFRRTNHWSKESC